MILSKGLPKQNGNPFIYRLTRPSSNAFSKLSPLEISATGIFLRCNSGIILSDPTSPPKLSGSIKITIGCIFRRCTRSTDRIKLLSTALVINTTTLPRTTLRTSLCNKPISGSFPFRLCICQRFQYFVKLALPPIR